MNLIDAQVTKVLSKPYQMSFSKDVWFVDVEYNGYGRLSETELMVSTEEDANAIVVGHKFLT